MANMDSILKKQTDYLRSIDNNVVTITDAIQYIEIGFNEEQRFESKLQHKREQESSLKMISLLNDIKEKMIPTGIMKDIAVANQAKVKSEQTEAAKASGKPYDVGGFEKSGLSKLLKESSIGNLMSLKKFATNIIGVSEESKLGKYLEEREKFKSYVAESKRVNPNFKMDEEDPKYKEFKLSSALKKVGSQGLSYGTNVNVQELAQTIGADTFLNKLEKNRQLHEEYAEKVIEKNPKLGKGKNAELNRNKLIEESKELLQKKTEYNELFDKLKDIKDIGLSKKNEKTFKSLEKELTKLEKQISKLDRLKPTEEATVEPVTEPSKETPTTVTSDIHSEIESLSDSIKESTTKQSAVTEETRQEDSLQKSKTLDVLQSQLEVQTNIFKILKKGKFKTGTEEDDKDSSSLFGMFGKGAARKGRVLKRKAGSLIKSGATAIGETAAKVGTLAGKGVSAVGGLAAGTKLASAGKYISTVASNVKASTAIGKAGAVVGEKLKGSVPALIGESIAKRLPSAFGKALGKSIPFIGAAIGVGEGVSRLMEGDVVGAGLSAVSGLGSAATAIPATIALLANDVYQDVYGVSPLSDPLSGERMGEIKSKVEEETQKFFESKAEKPEATEEKKPETIPPVEVPEPVAEESMLPEIKMPSLKSALSTANKALSAGTVSNFAKLMDGKSMVVDAVSSKIGDLAKSEFGVDTSKFAPENQTLNDIYSAYNKHKEDDAQQQSLVDNIKSTHDVSKKVIQKVATAEAPISESLKLGGKAASVVDTSAGAIRKLVEKKLPSMMGKVVGKSIPFLGTAFGLGEGISRLVDGDMVGAGMAAASGFGSAATAIPLSVGLLAKDIYKDIYKVEPENDPLAAGRLEEIKDIVADEAKNYINKAAKFTGNDNIFPEKPKATVNGEEVKSDVVYPVAEPESKSLMDTVSSSLSSTKDYVSGLIGSTDLQQPETPTSNLSNGKVVSNIATVNGEDVKVEKINPNEIVISTDDEKTAQPNAIKKTEPNLRASDTSKEMANPEKPEKKTSNQLYENSVKTEEAKRDLVAGEKGGNSIVNAPTNVNSNSTTNVIQKQAKNTDKTVLDYFQNRFKFNG